MLILTGLKLIFVRVMDSLSFGGVLQVGWKQFVSADLFIIEFRYIFVYRDCLLHAIITRSMYLFRIINLIIGSSLRQSQRGFRRH